MRERSSGPPLLTGVLPLIMVNLCFAVLCYCFAFTPFVHYLKRIALPCSSAAPLAPQSQQELVITLDAQGQGFIDTKVFSMPELISKLAELGSRAPHKHIVVRADGGLPFSTIRVVLKSAAKAGFQRVTVLVSEGHWPCGAT